MMGIGIRQENSDGVGYALLVLRLARHGCEYGDEDADNDLQGIHKIYSYCIRRKYLISLARVSS